MHGAFEGALPDGWQGGVPVTKYWNGDYIKLYRVTRPCNGCSAEISIDVTKKALQGITKNSGLLTRNCPTCKAARKAGGPGSRGGMSRPVVTGAPQASAAAPGTGVDNDELERLREWEQVMYGVLAQVQAKFPDATVTNLGDRLCVLIEAANRMHATYTALMDENSKLKAAIAQYDLQPAMAKVAENKFPWGQNNR